MEKRGFVYVLASRRHGTLYIGVTSNLEKRLHEHRSGLIEGFTKDYGVKRLVHYETFGEITVAIARERQLKKWNREWKINLIEGGNPDWNDLALNLGFEPLSEVVGVHGSPPPRG
jgi:putative endonuclease